jgi:protein-S-isoprenylcysteine O-methyltransferase Ste14
MSRNPRSLLLVFAQSLLLLYLFLTGPVIPTNLLSSILELGGIGLGLWSLWSMRITAIQITADVAPDSNLVSDGPFEFIRHPMYLAVILVSFGLLLNDVTTLRILSALLLTFDLIAKASYEEMLLVKYFKKSYEDYQKKTKRFIPFIY